MYRKLNFEVMSDTQRCYETIPELMSAVEWSIENQFMVREEDNIVLPETNKIETRYIVSGKRSFEAAKDYKGKKVAVLNYANNGNFQDKKIFRRYNPWNLIHNNIDFKPIEEALNDFKFIEIIEGDGYEIKR